MSIINRLGCCTLLCAASLRCETLALKTSFVKANMNKVLITASVEVDIHPNSPHSISSGGDDGDIHLAGRAKEIGLPFVAEIMNAGHEPQALTALKNSSTSTPISITGVWRIWFEHLGTAPQVQGQTVPAPSTSNPNHLFEIHPITKFGAVDVLDSLAPIPKYNAYPAKTSFPFYEKIPATVKATNTAILIASGEAKYNYTEFVMELAGKPQDVGDGHIALATVFDSKDPEEPVTAAPRRMVFVKDSPPAAELLKHVKGDTIHVLGIPRVSLAEVFAIAQKNGTKQVSVTLPYEMIVVAILP